MQVLITNRIFLLLSFFCLALLLSFSQLSNAQHRINSESPSSKASSTNTNLTYKIIDTPEKTYGYDVFINGKKLIHQPSIPTLAGNVGFKSKEDATKVALLVVDKIKQGKMPPAITMNELRDLKVIK